MHGITGPFSNGFILAQNRNWTTRRKADRRMPPSSLTNGRTLEKHKAAAVNPAGNESVPKIIINDNTFFLKLQSLHFGNFKPHTVSERCLTR